MKRFLPKNIFVSLLIVGMVFAPLSNTLQIQRAHALFGVGDTTFVIGDIPQMLKEYVGDSLAYTLGRAVISRMVESTVRWINSGFKGSPSFVTDLDGFLLDVADGVAGDFIYGTDLGFLCSPFELNIRSALAIQHYGTGASRNPSACTISGIGDNVDNFLDDAGDSGWGRWFDVTTQPQNNQYGAYAMAEAQLNASIVNARGEELQLLNFSGGFLSFEECTEIEGGGEECTISTPGQVIANSLNKSLGAGQDSLIQADEVNEIVGALLSQLVNQVLGGVGGLTGVSGGSSAGNDNRPYLDQLSDETASSESDVERGLITQARDLERQIQSQSAQVVSVRSDAIAAAEEIEDAESCNATTPLPAVLLESETKAQAYNEASSINIRSLERLLLQYATTPTDAIDDFNFLLDSGVLHTTSDLAEVGYLQNDASIAASLYISDVTQECGGSA